MLGYFVLRPSLNPLSSRGDASVTPALRHKLHREAPVRQLTQKLPQTGYNAPTPGRAVCQTPQSNKLTMKLQQFHISYLVMTLQAAAGGIRCPSVEQVDQLIASLLLCPEQQDRVSWQESISQQLTSCFTILTDDDIRQVEPRIASSNRHFTSRSAATNHDSSTAIGNNSLSKLPTRRETRCIAHHNSSTGGPESSQ